jgi:glutamyl-tRNA synthetase
MIPPITRLAPSPTGALHLGNARTFVVNWALARQRGWPIVLRIEDLDGPRIKHGADRAAIEDLEWLGLDWDQGPIYQSNRLPLYSDAINRLISKGLAYPCICTRREIDLAASAPHAEDGSTVYPGTCRGKFPSLQAARDAIRQTDSQREPAIRFAVPAGDVAFTDQFAGDHAWNVAKDLGDFVIAKSDNTPAYHLAVVVDDADMHVTHIVRGDDLLDSTPRQILLYRALELADKLPAYCHLPLLVGTDGRRLAKRHGDTRLAAYRAAGFSAAKMRALLARLSGVQIQDDEVTLPQLVQAFQLANLSRSPTVIDPAHFK